MRLPRPLGTQYDRRPVDQQRTAGGARFTSNINGSQTAGQLMSNMSGSLPASSQGSYATPTIRSVLTRVNMDAARNEAAAAQQATDAITPQERAAQIRSGMSTVRDMIRENAAIPREQRPRLPQRYETPYGVYDVQSIAQQMALQNQQPEAARSSASQPAGATMYTTGPQSQEEAANMEAYERHENFNKYGVPYNPGENRLDVARRYMDFLEEEKRQAGEEAYVDPGQARDQQANYNRQYGSAAANAMTQQRRGAGILSPEGRMQATIDERTASDRGQRRMSRLADETAAVAGGDNWFGPGDDEVQKLMQRQQAGELVRRGEDGELAYTNVQGALMAAGFREENAAAMNAEAIAARNAAMAAVPGYKGEGMRQRGSVSSTSRFGLDGSLSERAARRESTRAYERAGREFMRARNMYGESEARRMLKTGEIDNAVTQKKAVDDAYLSTRRQYGFKPGGKEAFAAAIQANRDALRPQKAGAAPAGLPPGQSAGGVTPSMAEAAQSYKENMDNDPFAKSQGFDSSSTASDVFVKWVEMGQDPDVAMDAESMRKWHQMASSLYAADPKSADIQTHIPGGWLGLGKTATNLDKETLNKAKQFLTTPNPTDEQLMEFWNMWKTRVNTPLNEGENTAKGNKMPQMRFMSPNRPLPDKNGMVTQPYPKPW